jgi:hypothetical protein
MKLSHLTTLSLALITAPIIAQESTGTLVGTVRDNSGNPIANARVVINSPNLLQPRTFSTNAAGEFRAALLPPSSSYTITVTATGFLTRRAIDIQLSAGSTRRQNFTLNPVGVATETIEVVAAGITVDKTETITATGFSATQLQNLPTGSLNAYGALSLAPGVSGATSYPVIRGGVTGQSQFLINGISVRDPLVRQGRQYEKVIDDMIEDIQIIQSPMNAKYGMTSAGIANIVTRTGGNQFSGSVRLKLGNAVWEGGAGVQRTPLRATEYYVNGQYQYNMAGLLGNYYSNASNESTDRTYEVALTGPIIKNYVTFTYAGRFEPPGAAISTLGSRWNRRNTIDPTDPPGMTFMEGHTFGQTSTTGVIVRGVYKDIAQNYKIFGQITPTQTVSVEYMDEHLGPYFDGQFGGVDAVQTRNQDRKANTLSVQYKGIFGSAIVELTYGRNRSEVQFSSGPGDPIYVGSWNITPSATAGLYTEGAAAVTGWGGTDLTNGDPGNGDREQRNTETMRANVQWLWNQHQFDFGFEQLKETVYAPGYPGINNRTYYVPGRAADGTYLVWNARGTVHEPWYEDVSTALWRNTGRLPIYNYLGTSPGDPKNYDTTRALYVNDYYTFNNHWSAMLGLRYETYDSENRRGTGPSTSDILPRFALKYDLNGDNQHLFEFNFGRFRGTIGQGALGGYGVRPNNRTANYYWNDTSVTGMHPYYVSLERLLDPNNYLPYEFTDSDFSQGLDPNLKPEVRNSVTFSYRRAYNTGYFRATGIYDWHQDTWAVLIPDWTPKTVSDWTGGGRPDKVVVEQLLTFDPEGKRDYVSVELEWQQRLYATARTQLTWNGNWTIARAKGTRNWREGNVASSTPSYYDAWTAEGYSQDIWNPYGELGVTPHNAFRTWLGWHIGTRGGVQTDLNLLLTYSTGSASNITANMDLPDSLMTGEKRALLASTGITTAAGHYFGNARGWYQGVDATPKFRLQWNMTVPVVNNVSFFSAVTVYELFNHFSLYGYASSQSGTDPLTGGQYSAKRGFPESPYWNVWPYLAGQLRRSYSTADARGFSVDMGLRF